MSGTPATQTTKGGNTADTKLYPLYFLAIMLPERDDAVRSSLLQGWVGTILGLHQEKKTEHLQVALFGQEAPATLENLQSLIGDNAGEIFGYNPQDHCFADLHILEEQLMELVNVAAMYRLIQSDFVYQGEVPVTIQQPTPAEVLAGIHFLANPSTLDVIHALLPMAVDKVGEKGELYGGTLNGVTIYYGGGSGEVFGEAPSTPAAEVTTAAQAGEEYSCEGCGEISPEQVDSCPKCGGEKFTVIAPPPPEPVISKPEPAAEASTEEPAAAGTEAVAADLAGEVEFTPCHICHHNNEVGAKFCAGCGQKLQPDPMVECEACDHPCLTGTTYCSQCGHKIGDVVLNPPAPAATALPQTVAQEPELATEAQPVVNNGAPAPPPAGKGLVKRLVDAALAPAPTKPKT